MVLRTGVPSHKDRDTEFCSQIKDLGKIRGRGNKEIPKIQNT